MSDLKRRLSNSRDTIDCPKNGDISTPILLMLEETFNWHAVEKISISDAIGKDNILEAIALLEGRSGGDLKDDATKLRRQYQEANRAHHQNQIKFEEYSTIKSKVAAAVLDLEKQQKQSLFSIEDHPKENHIATEKSRSWYKIKKWFSK